MRNLWSDRDARAAVKAWRAQGANEDVALCVYTTRLLGGEPRLVQHGGGNTSVKTRVRDKAGETVDVLCVKGSGWDMATIEPPGLPAVRLKPLLALAALPSSTIDWTIADGIKDIPIEERGGAELSRIKGRAADGAIVEVDIAPEGSAMANYAFDVTPAHLVTALITERGVSPASAAGLQNLFRKPALSHA